METVKIAFRKDKTGDITAVFVDEIHSNDYLLSCYAHIGQHGPCHISWVYNDTKPAKVEEYASLETEIRGIYADCNVKILNKLPTYEKTISLFR